ncbi:hypothetical protein G6F16_013986 [Rhizopus arrhizus]|nr:hypothetical protein G6F16_013986 [Rhizopus arrhizus]
MPRNLLPKSASLLPAVPFNLLTLLLLVDSIRRNLRLLGLDLSRVLDICFPGPKVIGLLVHVLYKEEVISLLSTAKVPLVDGFDPLDPVNLADPELQHLSLADKANECAELQFTRCSRALSRLGTGRAHLVGPIGKCFGL